MKQNWKYGTPQPPEHLDLDFEREYDPEMYDIVYLVKRSTYEFAFAVPKTHDAFLRGQRAFFQVRFRHQPEEQGFVLDLEALEDFYEGLSSTLALLSRSPA
jgi:hypothetical protein